MAWRGEGEGLGRGEFGGGGRSAAAGGRAASEALKVSLADIAAEPRTREAAAAAAEEEEVAAEAEGQPAPRPPVASRPLLCLAALPIGGKSSLGRRGRTGLRAPSWRDPDGARGSEPRRPRVSAVAGAGLGGAAGGAGGNGRGTQPAAGLASAGRAARASGRRGPRGRGSSECRRRRGLRGGKESFPGKSRLCTGSESPRQLLGPRPRVWQVLELATGSPAGPCQSRVWGGRGVPGEPGERPGVARCSAAPSVVRAGRFLPRCSRSCCPGRSGRRRA